MNERNRKQILKNRHNAIIVFTTDKDHDLLSSTRKDLTGLLQLYISNYGSISCRGFEKWHLTIMLISCAVIFPLRSSSYVRKTLARPPSKPRVPAHGLPFDTTEKQQQVQVYRCRVNAHNGPTTRYGGIGS